MTPDIQRLLIFLILLIGIQGGIDYYLYRKLSKYELFYPDLTPIVLRVFKATSLLMICVLISTTMERMLTGGNVQSGRIPQILIAVWYLPKYPIALLLSIADFFGLSRKVILTFSGYTTKQSKDVNVERRKVLHSIGLGLASVPFIATAKGVFQTIYDVEIRRLELVLPGLSTVFDGFRVVQISDIHTGSFFGTSYLTEVVDSINALQPDLLAITGDFVNFEPNEIVPFIPVLSKLKAKHGVFGSLGNHDHYMSEDKHAMLQQMISNCNIELLINEAREISIASSKLIIAGTDNTGFAQHFADIDKTFKGIDTSNPVILMAHDPTFWSMKVRDIPCIDLMLSGHTHGGQIGIEFLGTAYSPAQYVYEHWSGLYQSGASHLYVNRGLGTVGPPIRIGIRPEITVITLRSPVA